MERLRILLIEDHHASAVAMKKLLEASGHVVSIAETADAAIRLGTVANFDIIVTDIQLPDGSGLDVAKRLRREHPTIVVVGLSGHGQLEDIQRARKAGFDCYLVKPVTAEEVVEAAVHCIRSRGESGWVGRAF